MKTSIFNKISIKINKIQLSMILRNSLEQNINVKFIHGKFIWKGWFPKSLSAAIHKKENTYMSNSKNFFHFYSGGDQQIFLKAFLCYRFFSSSIDHSNEQKISLLIFFQTLEHTSEQEVSIPQTMVRSQELRNFRIAGLHS